MENGQTNPIFVSRKFSFQLEKIRLVIHRSPIIPSASF